MKRIFICGFYNFPRGSASSNYVQYLALSLIDAGYKVILITNINALETRYLEQLLEKTKGCLEIYPISLSSSKIRHYMEYRFFLGKMLKNALKECHANSEDLIVSYSSNLQTNKAIFGYARKHNIRCGACIVEWYPKEYFEEREKEYRQYKYLFETLFPKYDFLFPISSYIEDYFKSNSQARLLRLPILADPYEYGHVQKASQGKWQIVYPANGRMKDSLKLMLQAVASLNEEVKNNIEFHILGVKQDVVRTLIGEEDYGKIESFMVFHSWMKYDELIQLYENSHYLLLVRECNQLTLANFPSKVIEVMSYGVVPIASEVGDYTKFYLKDNKNAIIIKESSLDDIVNAVSKVCSYQWEEYEKISTCAYDTICDQFWYKQWSHKLFTFLEECNNGEN